MAFAKIVRLLSTGVDSQIDGLALKAVQSRYPWRKSRVFVGFLRGRSSLKLSFAEVLLWWQTLTFDIVSRPREHLSGAHYEWLAWSAFALNVGC